MINKNIKNLTKIFFKDYNEKIQIFSEKMKLNLKSKTVLFSIMIAALFTYLSIILLVHFNKVNAGYLFLKIYIPLVLIFVLFQLITLICNLFYYSKDLEYILPLPVKPIEILSAKFNTVILITYLTECAFLAIPMFFYGILVSGKVTYFLFGILSLLIMPIFYVSIIGSIILIMMKLFEKIKNKNVVQFLIIFILNIVLIIGTFLLLKNNFLLDDSTQSIDIVNEKWTYINKKLIITNPVIELLISNSWIKKIINIIKIFILIFVTFNIFILIGNKLYFNNLIYGHYTKGTNYNKNKIKYNKNKIGISYIKTENKKVMRNTTYVTQNLFGFINIMIIILIILNMFIPLFIQYLQDTNYFEGVSIDQLKIDIFCTVIVIMQIMFTFNSISSKAISREGKEAFFIKYIPVSLRKQLLIKLIPGVLLNIIPIIGVMYIFNKNLPTIECYYYIIAFITANLINILFNEIMIILDCKMPNLNWTNIESVTKNNSKKLYQYIITLITILLIIYLSKILTQISFVLFVVIFNLILLIGLIIFNIYINKNINKIFENIY